MDINPSHYKALFINGKRDKARRYESGNGSIISRRQFEKASGLLANRPSSQPKSALKKIATSVVSKVTGREVPVTQTGGKKAVRGVKISRPPSRYSADITNFAAKHNMKKGGVRKDPQFKLLNKEFSAKAKQRNVLINEMALKQRKKEDASKLIEQKNKVDEDLGLLARELGRKKPTDFTPFGQTV